MALAPVETSESSRAKAYRYFSATGCVFADGEQRSVFLGGSLVGSFTTDDKATRNALLVKLSEDPKGRLGKLAAAFEIGEEQLRRLRKKVESGGIGEVVKVKHGGRKRVVTPALRRKLFKLFEEGASINVAHAKIGKRISRTMVGRTRKAWAGERAAQQQPPAESMMAPAQSELTLAGVVAASEVIEAEAEAVTEAWHGAEVANLEDLDGSGEPSDAGLGKSDRTEDAEEPSVSRAEPAPRPASPESRETDEARVSGPEERVAGNAVSASKQQDGGLVAGASLHDAQEVSSALLMGAKKQYVQHAGTFIVLALLEAFGMYRYIERIRMSAIAAGDADGRYLGKTALRVALDAAVIALLLGHKCIEGVRRLATPSAKTLLRVVTTTPSESWVRKVLGRFAQVRGQMLHLATSFALIDQAGREHDDRAWFYVDNHMRPYTGKHVLRKGWRMQDKRARAGSSDYWVHDQDGRPLLRVPSPSHEPMTQRLRPIARLLRNALDHAGARQTKVSLVFDRAGAFPNEMAALRNAGIEFVTYERGPTARLLNTEFKKELLIGTQSVRFCEKRNKNLRRGRGRVRRIHVLMDDGDQVSIIGVSDASAEDMIRAMMARWAMQENQFKYAVERLGINQLDGRSVSPVPDDEIIPNPARRRLERALSVARKLEGEALRQLANLPEGDNKRTHWEKELARSRQQQRELQEQRPAVPNKTCVGDTELAGKLARHCDDYKLTIDTLRILIANTIADLAATLGPHLTRPREAKKTLDNLLAAPALIHSTPKRIVVNLIPAGTRRELAAFTELLRPINARKLSLPGDPARRPLFFKLQIERDETL